MPTFMLTHHFPRNFQTSPETAATATAWFERLGTSLVGRGNPAFETLRLGDCRTDPEQLAYTFISTPGLEPAIALAESWPLLARGGGIEVQELSVLQPGLQASG